MSVEAMAMVLHHSRAKGTAKLVLVGIGNHEGDGGAYPSHERLARYASVDVRNVRRAIDKLVAMGELVVEVQGGGDRDCPEWQRPNRYRIRVSCPSWCDRSTYHRDTRGKPDRLVHMSSTAVDEGGAPAPTPPAVGGGASAHPPGGASAHQTVPTTNPHQVVPTSLDTRPCQDCGQGEQRCTVGQLHWPPEDRHTYRPLAVRHASG